MKSCTNGVNFIRNISVILRNHTKIWSNFMPTKPYIFSCRVTVLHVDLPAYVVIESSKCRIRGYTYIQMACIAITKGRKIICLNCIK